MALFAELIVLFDLRLFQDAQGNEVFGQGFPWEQSLPHNLERRRKLKKKKKERKPPRKVVWKAGRAHRAVRTV